MTRHADIRHPLVLWLAAAGAAAFVLVGCGTGLKRALSGDGPQPVAYDVGTVGDRTDVGNATPIRLGGVGLVIGLEGTGGDCRHDEYRAMLVDDLKKSGMKDVNKALASNECALVIVEAELPPGAAKGSAIDLEVKLPPGSRATSIRGGQLRKCVLYNYDFAKNIRPDYNGPRGLLRGERVALAEGPVLMTGAPKDGATTGGRGRVWSGGRVLKEYPLALVMNGQSQRGALTAVVADRINDLFLPGMQASRENQIAHAGNNTHVSLRVPTQYQNNLPRYLRVVRFVPLVDPGDRTPKDAKEAKSYRQRLREDVLDPTRTVEAALRLEALGPKSVPVLQAGLDHKHPLVRFCCAEALAYLGSPACADELGTAARNPLYRAYALTALASLPEAACTSQLRELMESKLDDETRYGAFRALHALNPRAEAVRGEKLADSFTLHRVAPGMRSLIHLATTRRAEIVLFGESPRLVPEFRLLAGDFTLKAAPGDTGCTISRLPRIGDEMHRQCTLELEDVIRMMAEMGGQYADIVTLVQQASASEALSCQVRFDALPRAAGIEELLEAGIGGEKQDLGLVPNLYAGGSER